MVMQMVQPLSLTASIAYNLKAKPPNHFLAHPKQQRHFERMRGLEAGFTSISLKSYEGAMHRDPIQVDHEENAVGDHDSPRAMCLLPSTILM